MGTVEQKCQICGQQASVEDWPPLRYPDGTMQVVPAHWIRGCACIGPFRADETSQRRDVPLDIPLDKLAIFLYS